MRRWWQVAICVVGLGAQAVATHAAEAAPRKFNYRAPHTGAGLFDDKLGMLDREREEYATNLANHAAARVVAAGASQASLEEARRLLALSLQLSSRNKKALVVNYQLARGLMPKVDQADYSAEVLARLLLTRAQLLDKQGGPQNQLLSRCFVELAAEMDSTNEDAVYEHELQRIDHGDVDWSAVTDTKNPEPETDPAPTPVPAPTPTPAPGSGPAATPGSGPGSAGTPGSGPAATPAAGKAPVPGQGSKGPPRGRSGPPR